jgi:hypothetical protein
MRFPLFASLAQVALLAACSGNTATSTHAGDGGADAETESGTGTDAGGDVVVHYDGSGTCRAEPPTMHRPSASMCPSHETDAGVDSGGVGVCSPPHDACLADSDCGSTGVCDCEAPRCTEPFGTMGNVCVTSNCRVDSDCPCGFCAADTSCGGIDGYYCTTPHDECSTDTDCQDGGAFTQCRWSTDHWACVEGMGCPG